ncbi:MAG TPA: TIGR04282 family arsenosugar biosynthesis glycosyltransferase [Candidatus Kryptonia bacterium]|nr:TIGR04282 family arsenosugar biosynthesis glycosyltransferase [Candidatus Kryptonia bacterium]
MGSGAALVIMARYPAVGRVKTRLARSIGVERALALYRAFLRDLDVRFTRAPRPLVWAFHPPELDFAAVVTPGTRCVPQIGRDLGERMHNCFRLLCGEFERVLMIGVDAPHLRDEWLDEAERALANVDVVLGPSNDGGYYLIAMRQPHDVFSGVAMSTPEVLIDTQRAAARHGLRVHLLPPTFDVDTVDDLERLQRLLTTDVAAQLPATATLLRSWSAP